MAELLLMRGILAACKGMQRVDLKELFDAMDNPIMAPYTGDFDSFKNIFYRLNQEGVLKSRIEGDVLVIESIAEGSNIQDTIARLMQMCKSCATIEEFEEKVHTSELNRHFMDGEEIKAVYYHLEGERENLAPRSASSKNQSPPPSSHEHHKIHDPKIHTTELVQDPLSAPIVMDEREQRIEETKIEEMRGIFEKKLEKLKSMAKDYVEKLLEKENEIDVAVLRYLLNDLLPLRDSDINTDVLILDAIKERGLPFVLDGSVYKRQGAQVKVASSAIMREERTLLQRFALAISRGLMHSRFIGIDALKQLLNDEQFTIPESETMESLLEKAISEGFFKGYVDLVEQRVYRAKTENESYQEKFLHELNRMSKEITSDADKLKELKAVECKIPPSLETLLLSPDKQDITGVLDKAESVSQNLQDFIMNQVQVGKQVSVADLSKQLRDHVHKDHVDLPYAIDDEAVERILEKLVEDRKISGYFADQSNFIRKK